MIQHYSAAALEQVAEEMEGMAERLDLAMEDQVAMLLMAVKVVQEEKANILQAEMAVKVEIVAKAAAEEMLAAAKLEMVETAETQKSFVF